jgi:hypothetical protein
MRRGLFTSTGAAIVLALTSLVIACTKPSGEAPAASATPSALALAPTAPPLADETIPEFPSLDPSLWANGAPITFASLHRNVVLVEAWHRL